MKKKIINLMINFYFQQGPKLYSKTQDFTAI